MLFPMAHAHPAQAGEYGYWREGYWCDVTNNFCGTHLNLYYEYGHQYQDNEPYPTHHQNPLSQPLIRLCIAIIGCN